MVGLPVERSKDVDEITSESLVSCMLGTSIVGLAPDIGTMVWRGRVNERSQWPWTLPNSSCCRGHGTQQPGIQTKITDIVASKNRPRLGHWPRSTAQHPQAKIEMIIPAKMYLNRWPISEKGVNGDSRELCSSQ